MSSHRKPLLAVVFTVALALAACSGSGDKSLERLLMRDNEEPGFRYRPQPDGLPHARQTITGATAFAKEMRMTPADTRRLRDEGFIAFAAEPISKGRTGGVSNVARYTTGRGARHSMAFDYSPETIAAGGPAENVTFFTVAGVPGSRGWTASTPRVANASWVDGRCYYTLGNAGEGDLVGDVSRGVRAIYSRTKGHCS